VQQICRRVDATGSAVERQAGADGEWQCVTTNQRANSSNNKAFKEFTKRQKACIQAKSEHFEHNVTLKVQLVVLCCKKLVK